MGAEEEGGFSWQLTPLQFAVILQARSVWRCFKASFNGSINSAQNKKILNLYEKNY
jgi:hypothetical protein